MFRHIIILLLMFVVYSYAGTSQILIKNLNPNNPEFKKFSTLITSNKEAWLSIKKKFSPQKLQNIKPLSIGIYTIQKNDSVFSVAEQFNLNSDTIISFNSLPNSLTLKEQDTLLVPSMDGVVIFPSTYTTTERIARIYNIPEILLLYVNSISSGTINPKEEIFIPFAKMSDEEKNYFLLQPFSFPLDFGRFSSNYGMRFHPVRKRWVFHGGVDIAVPTGTRVYAAADGTVIHSGYNGSYGNLIVIKHKYGYTSWYGHLSKSLIKKGDIIKNRQMIAISGNTGISTGPHLHFEIRRFNLRENPMEILTFDHKFNLFKENDENDLEKYTD